MRINPAPWDVQKFCDFIRCQEISARWALTGEIRCFPVIAHEPNSLNSLAQFLEDESLPLWLKQQLQARREEISQAFERGESITLRGHSAIRELSRGGSNRNAECDHFTDSSLHGQGSAIKPTCPDWLLESEWNLSSVTPDCGNMREHETFVSAPWPGFLKSLFPGTSAQRHPYQS
jgi:hypothetical protein